MKKLLSKKIEEASAYVNRMLSRSNDDINNIINDAANFYSDNYSEYMEIWEALQNAFRFK